MNGDSTCNTALRPDGVIEIEAAPGRDTSVQFAVPVRELNLEAGRDQVADAGPKRSLQILCVDDDETVLEFMTDCLTHYGHQVKVASGGKAGMELFRIAMLKGQPYDVVVTDLGMPDVDGRQVARTIKAESPHTPVVMMTGWGAATKDAGDTTPGVDVVVNKPARIGELNDLLLRITKAA